MTKKKIIGLSRRRLLKMGGAWLGGALLAKGFGVFDPTSVFSHIESPAVHLSPIFLPNLLTQKRIYIAPDNHTDYFWSAGEDTYRQVFLEMIDYYLNKADATIATEPPEHQSRWNCDGSFWMWIYEKNKSAADFERFINRIKSGHISVPLNAMCICVGGAPTEAVLRGMYYSGQIERRYNLRFLLAYAIENTTLPYGLTALWAGAGAKYSWKGICGCDSSLLEPGNREHEIYWTTGPDGSRILMKWNSLVNNEFIGGYAEARDPSGVIEYVDTDPTFISRYKSPNGQAYGVIGAFGQGWDDLKTLDQKCVQAAKAKTNPNRKVIVSNEQDFFEDFETLYGTQIPSRSCSFGNEWDLYCAALAEVSARIKRAVEKLRGAEALATLVTRQDPGFMDGRQAARDQAWMDLGLFWEHNFGMVGPPSGLVNERIAWQKRLTSEVETYVNTLHSDALASLGDMIQKTGANTRFFAFNPLSWTRTDVADFPYNGSTNVKVIDLNTNSETPSQMVTIDGTQYLRILVQNVPAVGYKVFEIQSGTPADFSVGAPSINSNVIQNDLYQITLETRGAITSLIDKTRSNREFAKFINDLGGSGSGSVQSENVGSVSATLVANGTGTLNRTTRVTLFRGINRIEIRNDINQNFNSIHTWRFDFNLTNPDVWHEEVGAVIRAKLLNQGGNYSDRTANSRYDWLTLNHFADMTGNGIGVSLSNADCYFMKLGNSTVSTLDVTTPQLSVLVGGRVVNGNNGLPNQGGDTHFLQRFALQTHDTYDPTAAMKFALEHQNPLVTGEVTGGSVYPETSYSLLVIDNSNVLLWALKPADEGVAQGIIARVWNLSSQPQNFSLTLTSGPILSARRTTHIETPIGIVPLENGILTESLAAQQLKTFLLNFTHSDEKAFLPLVKKG